MLASTWLVLVVVGLILAARYAARRGWLSSAAVAVGGVAASAAATRSLRKPLLWGGALLALGALGVGLWTWGGFTQDDVTRLQERVGGALSQYSTASTPTTPATANSTPQRAPVADAIGQLPGALEQLVHQPPPPVLEKVVYIGAALWLLIVGQWGSKRFDKEFFTVYVAAIVLAWVLIVVFDGFVSDPWAKMGWFVVAMIANRYQPLLGFGIVFGLYVLASLAFH